jgi:hypothetical protein
VLNKNVDPTQYGIVTGKRARHELGTFLSVVIDNLHILKQFSFSTNSILFSNYLENFGSIEITSTNNLQFNLTRWLSFNYTMVLNYDEHNNNQFANGLVSNSGSNNLNNTGSKFQISNVAYLGININLNLFKNK